MEAELEGAMRIGNNLITINIIVVVCRRVAVEGIILFFMDLHPR